MLTGQALLKAVELELDPGEIGPTMSRAGLRPSLIHEMRRGVCPSLNNSSRVADAYGLDIRLHRKGERLDGRALFLAMLVVLDAHGGIEKLTPEVMHDLVGCYAVFEPMFHPVIASKDVADSWFPKLVTLTQAGLKGISIELIQQMSASGDGPSIEPTPEEFAMLLRYLFTFAQDFLAKQDKAAVKSLEAAYAAENVRNLASYMEFWAEEHGLPERERRKFRKAADECLASLANAAPKAGSEEPRGDAEGTES